jgi:hypothetical protein
MSCPRDFSASVITVSWATATASKSSPAAATARNAAVQYAGKTEGRARLSRQGRGVDRSFPAGMSLLPSRADGVHRGARARCVKGPTLSGHFMTVGIFQSWTIVLSICQGRQQASYCHTSTSSPSGAGVAGLSVRETISRLEYFVIETASSLSPKPRRRRCPLGSNIQFP